MNFKNFALVAMILSTMGLSSTNAQTAASAVDGKKQTLFSSVNHASTPYRIPAVATLNNGTVLAIADQRPCGADVGNGEVDIYAKVGTIAQNGSYSWNPSSIDPSANGGLKIADGTSSNGYGDAAVVVDRESGKVLVICVSGKVVFSNGSSSKHNNMARIVGSANGLSWESPQDVTSAFFANELKSAYTMFMASGRMIQSQFVKVGNYYRIYGALLVREKKNILTKVNNNYVVYSDDLGATWKVLGGAKAVSSGDEAKVEELPNGDIVLSSRTSGGRYFNVFKFSNLNNASGSWGSATKCSFAGSNSTNGELLFYKGLVDANGTEYNVMFQSLPTGSSRSNVAVYYKAFATNKSSWAVSDFTSGWTKGIEVDNGASGYSTMTILPNGQVGFLYEDDYDTSKASGDYSNIVYVPLTVEEMTGGKYSAPANNTEEPAVVVETPSFSPAGGEVQEGATVSIACATEGATIYYTTNGATPTTSSTKYTSAITVNSAMTIKAIAVKEGNYTNSEVATASYTIKAREVVATPTFSPAGGAVQEGATVSIACATEGATIYYTTNGATPTTASTKYTGTITVNSAMTIKAIAVKDGYYTNSAVASASYTIKAPEVVAAPTFSPAGGEIQEGATVTIACATSGATIYYTTNGATPTTSSTKYTGAITVNSAITIKAIAAKSGSTNSGIATASYTIKAREVVATPTFSPAGGAVQEGATVSIACATEGATIYYTTNGTTPTTASTKYTGAITVNSAMTIKAIAVKDGYYTNSAVASASYTIKAREVVATPVISPAGGEVEKGATVTISCATSGATIYYTTNGAEPTTSATKYTGAITVNSAMTIKAIAVKDGYYTNSAVATASFTVKAGTIDDATMQAIASAQAVAAYRGVGYPSSDAATRVALNNVIAQAQAGNATVSEIESAVNAFKNEVSDITMPEDGKTYKFVNVTKAGKKYYINYASSGISMVTNEAQATEYTCEFISHDEYAFIASNGSYLIWKGPNGKEGILFWKKTHGYNDNKGYTSSYNSTYCDLIVEKLTKGGYVTANSNAELFGLMGIRGMRYSRDEYSYFTIKSSDGTFDASVSPYFNDSYSSAFYIVDTDAVEMASEFDGPTSIEDNVTVDRVINDDVIYDITGRKVTETRPGHIYIKNGKKFLAK